MAEAITCLPVTYNQVRFQTGPCVKSGMETGVSASTSAVACQYHSTKAAYSLIHSFIHSSISDAV